MRRISQPRPGRLPRAFRPAGSSLGGSHTAPSSSSWASRGNHTPLFSFLPRRPPPSAWRSIWIGPPVRSSASELPLRWAPSTLFAATALTASGAAYWHFHNTAHADEPPASSSSEEEEGTSTKAEEQTEKDEPIYVDPPATFLLVFNEEDLSSELESTLASKHGIKPRFLHSGMHIKIDGHEPASDVRYMLFVENPKTHQLERYILPSTDGHIDEDNILKFLEDAKSGKLTPHNISQELEEEEIIQEDDPLIQINAEQLHTFLQQREAKLRPLQKKTSPNQLKNKSPSPTTENHLATDKKSKQKNKKDKGNDEKEANNILTLLETKDVFVIVGESLPKRLAKYLSLLFGEDVAVVYVNPMMNSLDSRYFPESNIENFKFFPKATSSPAEQRKRFSSLLTERKKKGQQLFGSFERGFFYDGRSDPISFVCELTGQDKEGYENRLKVVKLEKRLQYISALSRSLSVKLMDTAAHFYELKDYDSLLDSFVSKLEKSLEGSTEMMLDGVRSVNTQEELDKIVQTYFGEHNQEGQVEAEERDSTKVKEDLIVFVTQKGCVHCPTYYHRVALIHKRKPHLDIVHCPVELFPKLEGTPEFLIYDREAKEFVVLDDKQKTELLSLKGTKAHKKQKQQEEKEEQKENETNNDKKLR
ncbi:hypothetical protein QOT17_024193 [Balamuthia mandrillaris]